MATLTAALLFSMQIPDNTYGIGEHMVRNRMILHRNLTIQNCLLPISSQIQCMQFGSPMMVLSMCAIGVTTVSRSFKKMASLSKKGLLPRKPLETVQRGILISLMILSSLIFILLMVQTNVFGYCIVKTCRWLDILEGLDVMPASSSGYTVLQLIPVAIFIRLRFTRENAYRSSPIKELSDNPGNFTPTVLR